MERFNYLNFSRKDMICDLYNGNFTFQFKQLRNVNFQLRSLICLNLLSVRLIDLVLKELGSEIQY